MNTYTATYEKLAQRLAEKSGTSIPCASESDQSHQKNLVKPSKLQVKKSKVGGYGVFAIEDISKGEVVEEAPFIRSDFRDKDKMAPQMIQVCYTLPCKCKECKAKGNFMLISSGNIHIYNHLDDGEDVKFDYFPEKRFIRVTAINDIKKGKEVFHNYGDKYNHWEELDN